MNQQFNNRLAVSTVWAKARSLEAAPHGPGPEAAAILAVLDQLDLDLVELEYRLTGEVIERLLPEFKARGWRVGSVHNYAPLPVGVPRDKASGDLFNLASPDRAERERAVAYTLRTMELASDLEAAAVVLHLGEVSGVVDKGVIRRAATAGAMTPELAAHMEKRAVHAPRHLDAVSFSLERLAERAAPLGVALGLENRYHAYQIPSLPELSILLERFSGAPLGLWYDCGHAWVHEQAGIVPASDWLSTLGPGLVGCHLHDAVGQDDHQAPGAGKMDWPAPDGGPGPSPAQGAGGGLRGRGRADARRRGHAA
ncbi:MAG: sugar phosphate isomerase/epimerase [Desulfarculaceae bacterium]|nr:sugar phosphate isomerase/epimerase [Desulfarculaceae bacterium]